MARNTDNENLADALSDHLEILDENLLDRGVEISQRPMLALIKLLLSGDLELRVGDEAIDISNPTDHAQAAWFKALYAAAEQWYTDRYGEERASGSHRRNNMLQGAVLIRGEAYYINVPTYRRKVEIQGEQAWIYFQEDLENSEDSVLWINNAPSHQGLSEQGRRLLRTDADFIASTLRFIEFRRVTGRQNERHPKAQKLIEATLIYIQQAAQRMVKGSERERVLAWFDLQMANESALKAALQQATGKHPYSHSLKYLLYKAEAHGVQFDASRLNDWPAFNDMSDFRYGEGEPCSMAKLYAAYLLTLDVMRAAIGTIRPGLKPGFGILLQYPPWKSRPAD